MQSETGSTLSQEQKYFKLREQIYLFDGCINNIQSLITRLQYGELSKSAPSVAEKVMVDDPSLDSLISLLENGPIVLCRKRDRIDSLVMQLENILITPTQDDPFTERSNPGSDAGRVG